VDLPLRQVDPARGRQHEPYPWKSRRQRDRDIARVEQAGRHLGQQRQVQEVVGRVDQHHLGPVAGEPVQFAGGVEAGEAGTDDHDSGSRHAL
jgi:hypothetical protein